MDNILRGIKLSAYNKRYLEERVSKKLTRTHNSYRRHKVAFVWLIVINSIISSLNAGVSALSQWDPLTDYSMIFSIVNISISVIITVITVLISKLQLTQKSVHNEIVYETIISETWRFKTLSGDYNTYANHDEAFNEYINKIEELIIKNIHEKSNLVSAGAAAAETEAEISEKSDIEASQ